MPEDKGLVFFAVAQKTKRNKAEYKPTPQEKDEAKQLTTCACGAARACFALRGANGLGRRRGNSDEASELTVFEVFFCGLR